jgi:hypothetical protein
MGISSDIFVVLGFDVLAVLFFILFFLFVFGSLVRICLFVKKKSNRESLGTKKK